MAAGTPVVAHPVGALRSIVRNGETGFLAATPREWVDALDSLIRDRDLRRRLGEASRAAVRARWSFEAHRETYLAALEGREPAAAGSGPGPETPRATIPA
jgi:glycosyltransferase involved in cell wall biosynthesis